MYVLTQGRYAWCKKVSIPYCQGPTLNSILREARAIRIYCNPFWGIILRVRVD